MEIIKTKGIVISATKHGEHGKLLTLFTDTLGVISVSAKGVNSRHNNLKAATRVLCCGDFVLNDKKNGYYTLSEVSLITDFMGLSKDLQRLEAASKLLKFIKFVAVENEDSTEMLRLLLNSLHMLANTKKNVEEILCIYFLKALEYMGLPPVTNECAVCGSITELKFFSPESGGMVCRACSGDAGKIMSVSEKTASYMDYILNSSLSAAFGVEAEKEIVMDTLNAINMFLKQHLSPYTM